MFQNSRQIEPKIQGFCRHFNVLDIKDQAGHYPTRLKRLTMSQTPPPQKKMRYSLLNTSPVHFQGTILALT